MGFQIFMATDYNPYFGLVRGPHVGKQVSDKPDRLNYSIF